MKLKSAQSIQSVQWLPAERLGQLQVDANLRPWLIAKGMLSARLKAACGERFGLRLIDQWTGLLTSSQKLGLRADDNAGLFRDVEMARADQVWVFAQTVTPDSTLCLHPWLAELGDTALDETLNGLSGVERSSYEYAWLPDTDPLTARALREAEVKPSGLWARRARVALRGAPLLMQEVFLPVMGRV
ncbi:MAG TPA: chorismate lyase [Steroidobacteraceae bacterium]|jgi:chorismate--pyruvate lyase|nr:chorismate lyase [Steroidobacteraceae bacterium]